MRLEAFLPQDRRRALAGTAELPDRAAGAAMFVDLAGFTALTERLATRFGPLRGAEELSRLLASVYEDLVGEVEAFGGSVIGFSGDAITCWFDHDDGTTALRAAHALQHTMRARRDDPLPDGTTARLGAKVAVAVGPVRRFVVGDPDIQLIDVIAGRTLESLAAAERMARTGEIVVSLDGSALDGSAPDGPAPELRIEEVRDPDGGGPRVAVVAQRSADPAAEPRQDRRSPGSNPVPALPDEIASPWVLASVRDRIRHGADAYLAGFRPAAALFQSFHGIAYDEDPRAGEKLDAYVRWVQGVVSSAGGTLVQLTIGDKGSYLYVAFGAPTAHHDDAARAVAVARQLARPPQPFVTEVRTGVTFGQMFTGTYGSTNRCTYGVLGPRTNLAARLMSEASPGEILCNEDVVRHASRAWAFEPRGDVTVKGVPAPVATYVPVGEASGSLAAHGVPAGRLVERKRLDEALDDALAGAPRVVALVGEAGSGKSRLLTYVAECAAGRGVTTAAGTSQIVARATAYHPWRSVMRDLLALPRDVEPAHLPEALSRLAPDLATRAELLEDVLWPELVRAERSGAERKSLVIGTAVAVVRAAVRRGPVLLALDDLQWFDNLSLEVLEAVRQDLGRGDGGLLVVLATRPTEASGHAAEPFADDPLVLGPMPADDLLELAARYLDVDAGEVPRAVAEILRDRTDGNPFLVEALLDDMLERGVVRVTEAAAGGKRTLVVQITDEVEAIPTTVKGLVLSRLDRLPPPALLTLKTAAVIGRSFAVPPLDDTLSKLAAFDGEAVRDEIDGLTVRGFVDPDATPSAYRFRQALTAEVAYDSLLFAQRRALHRHLAEWYRARPTADPASIAYHAYYAAHRSNDARLLETAAKDLLVLADHQLSLGAYRDVVATSRRALDLLPDEPAWRVLRATFRVRLGVVQEHLSDYDDAQTSLEAALADARAAPSPELVTDALNALCMVFTRRGDLDAAEAYAQEAVLEAQQAGYRAGMTRARSRLGILAAYRGDHERAADEYQAALALASELDDLVSMSSCLSNLGLVRIYQERPAEARPLLERAMAVAERLENRHLWARFVTNLGLADEHLGELGKAEEHYRSGLTIFEDLGARQEAIVNVLNLGDVAMRRGNPDRARTSYLRALAEGLELGAVPVALSAVGGLAWAAARSGEPERAAELLGLTLDHPARDTEVEQHGAMVLEEVAELLDPEALERARRRGRATTLEDVARRLTGAR
jgi:class 3 adenylate cyclase/predicted ATPase